MALLRLDELTAHAPSQAADPRIAELLAAIDAGPATAPLHNDLGNVYAERGDGERALAAYKKAVEIDPGDALAPKNMAILSRRVLRDEAMAARHLEHHRALTRSAPR